MTTWNINAARKWMLDAGMQHIRDGEFLHEGAELIHDAEVGGNYKTMESFRIILHDILWWDTDDINNAVGEVLMSETQPQKNALTTKDVFNQLIEPYHDAWMALPTSIRDMMIAHPEKFELRKSKEHSIIVVYNGVLMRPMYGSSKSYWVIEGIELGRE